MLHTPISQSLFCVHKKEKNPLNLAEKVIIQSNINSKFGNKAFMVNISEHQSDSSIIKIISLFQAPCHSLQHCRNPPGSPWHGGSDEDILTARHFSQLAIVCFTEAQNGLSKLKPIIISPLPIKYPSDTSPTD